MTIKTFKAFLRLFLLKSSYLAVKFVSLNVLVISDNNYFAISIIYLIPINPYWLSLVGRIIRLPYFCLSKLKLLSLRHCSYFKPTKGSWQIMHKFPHNERAFDKMYFTPTIQINRVKLRKKMIPIISIRQ